MITVEVNVLKSAIVVHHKTKHNINHNYSNHDITQP